MNLQTVSDVTLVRMMPFFGLSEFCIGPKTALDVPVRKASLRPCPYAHYNHRLLCNHYVAFLQATSRQRAQLLPPPSSSFHATPIITVNFFANSLIPGLRIRVSK